MTTIAWALDAVTGAPEYTGRALRQTMSPLVAGATDARPLGARSGVRIGTPAATVSTDGFDWTVGVHGGTLDLQSSATAGPYTYAVTVAETGTIDAAHATLARVDILYVQVDDPSEDDSTVPAVTVNYLAGTAAGSPVAPATPARSMVIGTIPVPASGGGDPSVVWTAPYTGASGCILPVRTDTERDALAAVYDATAANPLILWHIADERITVSVDGSAWEEVAYLTDITAAPTLYPGTVVLQAVRSTAQSLGASSNTAISWSSAAINPQTGWVIGSPTRFTPTVAGKYVVSAKVSLASTSATFWFAVSVQKNGSVVTGSRQGQTGNWVNTNAVSADGTVVEMNGTTDYIEVYAIQTHSSAVNTGAVVADDYPTITVVYGGA